MTTTWASMLVPARTALAWPLRWLCLEPTWLGRLDGYVWSPRGVAASLVVPLVD
jgi:hypothetical protein